MQAPADARWPEEKGDRAHAALKAVYQTVRGESVWRLDADEKHLGFYKMSERHGVRGSSMRDVDEYEQATLPNNICRGAVDTLQAKIAKQRPLPECLTKRGNWKNQKRARKMTQALEGEFYRQRIYEKHAPMIVRDALIFGRGHLRVWVENARIKCERLFPWEVLEDPWDGRYGSPRNRYYPRSMDRGVALEAFARTPGGGMNAKIERAIMQASRFGSMDQQQFGPSTVDRIDIVTAVHLCDDPDGHADDERDGDDTDAPAEEPEDVYDDEEKDDDAVEVPSGRRRKHKCTGRQLTITTAGIIKDEPWPYDYFPDVSLSYNEAVVGSQGTGLVEQLEGYQYQSNLASEVLDEQYRLSGVHVFLPDNAKISYQDIRNGINVTGHAAGGTPSVFQMDLVNEHMRSRPRELREDALNDAGLSALSVQSEKPAGVTAAVAIQTLADIETERFFMFGRGFETWNVELGRRFIDGSKLIAKKWGDHAVSVPMKGGLLPLKWSDVYVDGVEIRCFATSLLPDQPAARKQVLEDMWDKQQIDRLTYLRLVDDPDLQAEIDLETADRMVVDEMLERMLDADEDEGEAAYMPPSEYQQIWVPDPKTGAPSPGWAPRRAQQRYNRALLDGAPEYNLDLLQRYMKQCDDIMQKQIARAQAPAVAQPANVNGVPELPAQPAPMPGASPMAA